MTQQKLYIDPKNRVIIYISARCRDKLKLKNGDEYEVRKGRGRRLIIDFDLKDEKK